jgi:uncharacterized membrane protein YebE (DUF533 family)
MSIEQILDTFLNTGKELVEKGKTLAEAKLNIPEDSEKREAMLSGAGKGALAAGALAVLLGTGAGRKLTGTALKLGSLAAVGGIAYKALQNWQNKDSGQVASSGKTANDLTGEQRENRSRALLKAMIAAAKADGHIDDKEKDVIAQHAEKLGLNASIAGFIKDELANEVSAKEVAAEADSPEAAAEFYLVSRMILDLENDVEKKYIAELTKELDLAPELIAQLDEQIAA